MVKNGQQIYIEELNLAIEYDGIYWHGKKENIDKKKSIEISNNGIHLIRIRQSPLEKINESDIIFTGGFNGKSICNKILKYIKSNFKLTLDFDNKIDEYLNSKKLMNTKIFQKYIHEKLGDRVIKNS